MGGWRAGCTQSDRYDRQMEGQIRQTPTQAVMGRVARRLPHSPTDGQMEDSQQLKQGSQATQPGKQPGKQQGLKQAGRTGRRSPASPTQNTHPTATTTTDPYHRSPPTNPPTHLKGSSCEASLSSKAAAVTPTLLETLSSAFCGRQRGGKAEAGSHIEPGGQGCSGDPNLVGNVV